MEHPMVKQSNRDGGTVEQSWRNSKHLMVEHLNRDVGTVEDLMVEEYNILWWNSTASDVEKWKNHG